MVIKGFMTLRSVCTISNVFNQTFPENVQALSARLNKENIMVMSDDTNTSTMVFQRYYKACQE